MKGITAVVLLGAMLLPYSGGAASGAIDISRHAEYLNDGSIQVTLVARCTGGNVLEANLTVSQEKRRAFSQTGFGGITCDGSPQSRTVTARPIEGGFGRGPAHASAFMSVCDENFNCASINRSQRIIAH